MATTSSQTFSTSDLRSKAIDYKRDVDNKSKWAHGQSTKRGRNGHAAPVKAQPRLPLADRDAGSHRRAHMYRHAELHSENPSSADDSSSADEDVTEPSAAPEPDAGIAYSFDAVRGPSQGSQILSLAVAKAVERYESSVTEGIVQREWEVLDQEGEIVAAAARKAKAKAAVAAAGKGKRESVDEAEYEFV